MPQVHETLKRKPFAMVLHASPSDHDPPRVLAHHSKLPSGPHLAEGCLEVATCSGIWGTAQVETRRLPFLSARSHKGHRSVRLSTRAPVLKGQSRGKPKAQDDPETWVFRLRAFRGILPAELLRLRLHATFLGGCRASQVHEPKTANP